MDFDEKARAILTELTGYSTATVYVFKSDWPVVAAALREAFEAGAKQMRERAAESVARVCPGWNPHEALARNIRALPIDPAAEEASDGK